MCYLRAEKIKRIANLIPEQEVFGKEEGDLLVIGWGGTYGSLYSAVDSLLKEGESIALCQFNYINPLPNNISTILSKYKKIVVCELNSGQFANYLRMNFEGVIFNQYNKIQGFPFTTSELESHFKTLLTN
jgi:2-oxoglutarate ferredoxin oxidoreductase subunit alpha